MSGGVQMEVVAVATGENKVKAFHAGQPGGPGHVQGQGGRRGMHRFRRRQHQHGNRKHYHRIRRNTQPAPNNTNEFLMQEHDHLYHLDFEVSGDPEWEHNSSGGSGGQGALGSSEEDEQDYLCREFSATYDTVNAERLSSMSKAELITEYQILQERVETLERRLKRAEGSVELRELREENEKIKQQNLYLQQKLEKRGDCDELPNPTEQVSVDSSSETVSTGVSSLDVEEEGG